MIKQKIKEETRGHETRWMILTIHRSNEERTEQAGLLRLDKKLNEKLCVYVLFRVNLLFPNYIQTSLSPDLFERSL